MTQEEKKLLLIDLCARLPYGVMVENVLNHEVFDLSKYLHCLPAALENFKPYLRPMSSMTEEEIEEYRNLSDEVIGTYGPYHREFIAHCVRLGIKPDNPHECIDEYIDMDAIDWLNEHHFDYRIDPSTGKTLIESGLALKAPEGMYKTE